MIEILKENPKAGEKIREYYEKLFIERLKGFDETQKQELIKDQFLTLERAADLLEGNPYFLVYLLDENGVFLEINITNTPKKEDTFFSFAINNIVFQNGLQASTYNHRKEAEKEGVIRAIQLLESKI